MTSAVLLVLAALAAAPELCAGKKGGGVAREAQEDVSEGYVGAVELGSAEDKKVIASTPVTSQSISASISERKNGEAKRQEEGKETVAVASTAATAVISERAVKDASGSLEDFTSHRRKSNYKPRQDEKDVSEGYAGAQDLPDKDEEFPAIVGQLPQSDEELPGLKDVEMVEEIEEYVLFFGVVVFFVFFGVFPALQHFRADGKGGMDTLMEMAIRFSVVQQAVAVLGLTHHLNGMVAMQQQQQQEQAKQHQPRAASQPPRLTVEKAASYTSSNFRDESYAPSSAHGQSHKFEPEHCPAGSNIGSLLELAMADNVSAEPAGENNLLDSLGLIDTEEPLL